VRRGRAAQVPLKAYHHAYEVQGRVHAPVADACRPRAAQRRRTQVREVLAHMRGSRVHARCSRAAQASYQVHNRAYLLCGCVLVRLVDALRPRAAQRRRTEVMVARGAVMAEVCRCGAAGLRTPCHRYATLPPGCVGTVFVRYRRLPPPRCPAQVHTDGRGVGALSRQKSAGAAQQGCASPVSAD
jgi:hypothetical protein